MFVVFEGIDGSGKTTISNKVATALAQEGLSVKHLREGGKFVSPVSEGIREFGRNAQNLHLAWQSEFLLYVARDVQLIHEALRPALADYDLVLADRFLYTPEVLGRHGRRLPESFTQPILRAAADGLEPDLVILVDVDPTYARARRKLRKLGEQNPKPPSRKGLSGVGLQQRLRRGYLAMADEHPERWVVLENQDSLDRTVARALELIRDAHREGAARAIARFRAKLARPMASAQTIAAPEDALEAFLRLTAELGTREPRVAAYLLGGMRGPRIDEQRLALFEQAPDAVIAALADLADETSFELRRRAKGELPGLVLRSLGLALETSAGWQLFEELSDLSPAEALSCVNGLDHERAWQLRRETFDKRPTLAGLVVGTLGGLGSEQAWELREKLIRSHTAQLDTSYELWRVLAKSVTGLADERAWRIRRDAQRLAPVAALQSLTGVTDPESWELRRSALHKAPKVVMATLRGLHDARAWQMRSAVASDCKEALDGLQGVASEPAWALRDQNQDVWPSTVVKTLADLADGERGRALVERQLRAYPDNVSLLKHVSSIALGLHHLPADSGRAGENASRNA